MKKERILFESRFANKIDSLSSEASLPVSEFLDMLVLEYTKLDDNERERLRTNLGIYILSASEDEVDDNIYEFAKDVVELKELILESTDNLSLDLVKLDDVFEIQYNIEGKNIITIYSIKSDRSNKILINSNLFTQPIFDDSESNKIVDKLGELNYYSDFKNGIENLFDDIFDNIVEN